jgi:hypothetical protein
MATPGALLLLVAALAASANASAYGTEGGLQPKPKRTFFWTHFLFVNYPYLTTTTTDTNRLFVAGPRRELGRLDPLGPRHPAMHRPCRELQQLEDQQQVQRRDHDAPGHQRAHSGLERRTRLRAGQCPDV